MFKTIFLTAMVAVLFSPVCLADDDADNRKVDVTYAPAPAPAPQPVVVSDDHLVQTIVVDTSYLDAGNRFNYTKPAVAFRLQQEPACECECECK